MLCDLCVIEIIELLSEKLDIWHRISFLAHRFKKMFVLFEVGFDVSDLIECILVLNFELAARLKIGVGQNVLTVRTTNCVIILMLSFRKFLLDQSVVEAVKLPNTFFGFLLLLFHLSLVLLILLAELRINVLIF